MDTNDFDLSRAIGLADAAKLMRGRRGSPAVDTLRRWANPLRGWRAGGSAPLVLRTVRINGELLTMPGWVREFERERIRLGSRSAVPEPALPRARTRRRREHEQAEEILSSDGIGKGKSGS